VADNRFITSNTTTSNTGNIPGYGSNGNSPSDSWVYADPRTGQIFVRDSFGNVSPHPQVVPNSVTQPSMLGGLPIRVTPWLPSGIEVRPCHPDLPWSYCGVAADHPPHRGILGTSNCLGASHGWKLGQDEAERAMRQPQAGDFVMCSCGCGCDCDGGSHFNDNQCPCFYLKCSCLRDAPDEPLYYDQLAG
jgi:hypothetical protein